MSTITLLKRGRPGAIGSRHINMRYFWLTDRIANGELKVIHTPTAEMIANIPTKPLQGAQFVKERQLLSTGQNLKYNLKELKEDTCDLCF